MESNIRKILNMSQQESRAKRLRLRVFEVLGHGGVTRIARDIGKSPTYVGNILSEYGTAAPTLDLIEKRLDEIEREQALERAA